MRAISMHGYIKNSVVSILSLLMFIFHAKAFSDPGACVRAYMKNHFPYQAIYNMNHQTYKDFNIRNHFPTPIRASIVGPQGELFFSNIIDGYVVKHDSVCDDNKPCSSAIDGSESNIDSFSSGFDVHGNNGEIDIGTNYLWVITDELSGALIDVRIATTTPDELKRLKSLSKQQRKTLEHCQAPVVIDKGSDDPINKQNVWHILPTELTPPNSIGSPPTSNAISPIPSQGAKFLTGGSYLGSYKEQIFKTGDDDPTVIDKEKRHHFLMRYQSWYLSASTISLLPGETRTYVEEISRGIQASTDINFEYSASLGLNAEIPLGDVPIGASESSSYSFGVDLSISLEEETTTINQRRICNSTEYPVTFLQWQLMDTYTIWKFADKDNAEDYSDNYGFKVSSTMSSLQSAILTTVLWTDNNGKQLAKSSPKSSTLFTCDIKRTSNP